MSNRQRGRTRYVIGLLLALAMVASACGSDEPSFTAGPLGAVTVGADEPIKFAALQSISGATASLGTDEVRGIEIAIDDRGGELLDHTLSLQVEDDLCSSEGGTTGAQKIVSDPQMIGIIGTSCSGAGVPASQIMSQAGLVMISGSNTSPVLTSAGGVKGSAWQSGYFRTAHNDGVQGAAAAKFVYEELGLTKAATIHDGDPYTQGLTSSFEASYKELGGEITLATAVNKGDTDMRPVLTEVAASGAEMVFFPIFQPEGDFIAAQAQEVAGMENTVLMGADGLLSDTYVTLPDTKGMYFSGPATPTTGAYEDFVAKYEAKYGEKPIQAFHAHAYDAANMLFDAIEEVAEVDGDTVFIDREKLREALYDTSGFAGLTGSLTCDEFGDCADAKIEIFQNTDATPDITAVKANVLYTFEP